MAIQFFSTGPALVKYDDQELGFCENGVDINIQPFFEDLHTDSWGGLAGPFADRQLLGAIAQVNCLLTKFDDAAVAALTAFTTNSTAGVIGDTKLGEFIYQDGLYSTLAINVTATAKSIQFEYAHVAGSVSFNASMRHRRWQLQFLCRMDDPCLRNLYSLESAISCFDD
jgi:hypothetical protein